MKEGEAMIYVMSDLHGEYDKYIAMLDLIQFSMQDTLYIIGDMIDRGEHGIKILQDMMSRENVYPILGNHEYMAASCLQWLKEEITIESIDHMNEDQIESLVLWFENGGYSTLLELQKLSHEKIQAIYEYMLEFPLYETVKIRDCQYILVHAGLGHFDPHKPLDEYTIDELIWQRGEDDIIFDDQNIYVLSGHTPTPLICHEPKIFKQHQQINIDCGASFQGGRLACLCLNTMEEYYID